MIAYPHVDLKWESETPAVTGTRVPVHRLWNWHRKGVTVETLVKRYGALGPAKVLCALAFAYDNQELMEKCLERERQLLDAGAPTPEQQKLKGVK